MKSGVNRSNNKFSFNISGFGTPIFETTRIINQKNSRDETQVLKDKSAIENSYGYLFKKIPLLLFSIVLVWSAWTGQTGVLTLVGLVLATAGFTKLWAAVCLKRVECLRVLDKNRVFPGNTIDIKLEVSNKKLLPLLWIKIDEQIPLAMAENQTFEPCDRIGFGLLTTTTSILGYSKVHWVHSLICKKRGYYKLGSLKLTSGDLFGFLNRTQQLQTDDDVIVYPQIYSIEGNYFPSHSPLGESKADQNIFHDPSRVVGLRDYTHHDSLRHVHWKASARQQHLQVKVFESTVTIKTAVFLSVDSFQTQKYRGDYFELAVSTAASIAMTLIERKGHVGLYANTWQVASGDPVNIPPASSQRHLMQIMETLAKCQPSPRGSFETLVETGQPTLSWGCTIVSIIAAPGKDIEETLLGMKAAGYKIMILLVGKPGEYKTNPELDYYQVVLNSESKALFFKKLSV